MCVCDAAGRQARRVEKEIVVAGTNKMLGGGGFHHVAIRVSDFDASVKFYTQTLGFRPATGWGEGDKRAVMLDTGDGNYLEVFAGGTTEPKPEGTILHIAFRTADVDAAIARVRSAGMEITTEPKSVEIPSQPPLPIRLAFFKGPDGEVVELFQLR